MLAGACRHFEDTSITLTTFASAPTGRADIIEIKVLNRIKNETIQCLGHWLLLEPRHSSESEDRIAAHLRNIRTSRCFGVHHVHLPLNDVCGHIPPAPEVRDGPRFHVSRPNEVSPKGLAFTHANEDVP